jgi:hypothetical protein
MIEAIIYLVIGFLVAALFGLLFAAQLHNRGERLTTKRLDAAKPSSLVEMRADKDQQRAELAMSLRRLETNIERMKTKTAAHLVRISKKTEMINELNRKLDEKTATIIGMEGRDNSPRNQLATPRRQIAIGSLREAAHARPDVKATLRRHLVALAEESRLLDTREFDIKRRRDQLNHAGGIEDDL